MKIPFDETKKDVPFLAFGYVQNFSIDLIIEIIESRTDEDVTKEELNRRIYNSWQNDKVILFQYVDGNPHRMIEYSKEKTIAFGVDIGFTSKSGKNLYACYQKNNKGWKGVYICEEYQIYNKLNAYRMGNISFKDYEAANKFIKNLHKRLLPGEQWYFKNSKKEGWRCKTDYPILESYLKYTYEKLYEDNENVNSKNKGKIIYSNNKNYALFNTGLLSYYAKDIYIFGEVGNGNNLSNPQIVDRMSELENKYDFEKNIGTKMPEVVDYFDDTRQIIFDTKKQIDLAHDKLEHIIKDGRAANRFPAEYNEDEPAVLTNKLSAAIDNAVKIAKRNYKYVVPQYRPGNHGQVGKIQFLMPIYLDNVFSKEADFALVLNEEDNYYIPETILVLAWAYNNARLICKPDDAWLKPGEIVDVIEGVDDIAIETEEREKKEIVQSKISQTTNELLKNIPESAKIGEVGYLTNIELRKLGKGLKGEIFGCTGTLKEKGWYQKRIDDCKGSVKVEIIGINPQGDQYLLEIVDNECLTMR